MTSPRARGVLKPLLPKTSGRPRGPPVTYKDLLPSPTSSDAAPAQQNGSQTTSPSSSGAQRQFDPRESTPTASAQSSQAAVCAGDSSSARKVKSMMNELELM